MKQDLLEYVILNTPIYAHIIIDKCSDDVIEYFTNANIPDLIILKDYESFDFDYLFNLFFKTNDKKILLMNKSSTFLQDNDWAIKFTHFNFTP